MTIARVVRKTTLAEQPKDSDYWRTQSYEQRLTALEEIRRDYHRWKYNAEPRLQRVYTVIERKRASGRLQDLADVESLESTTR
jgi:hypothetical protein